MQTPARSGALLSFQEENLQRELSPAVGAPRQRRLVAPRHRLDWAGAREQQICVSAGLTGAASEFSDGGSRIYKGVVGDGGEPKSCPRFSSTASVRISPS